MEISAYVYQKFYDVLIEHIALNELSENQRNAYGTHSYLIWTEVDAATGRSIFEIIFGMQITDPLHFYKKKSQLNPQKVGYGNIKDGLIVTALRYLGFKLPSWDFQKQMPLWLRAKILYQLFLETHMPDFYKRNESDYKIYDHETSKVLLNKFDFKPEIEDEPFVFINPVIIEPEVGHTDITDVIFKYLQTLNQQKGRNFKIAWDILSEEAKNKFWNGNYDFFYKDHDKIYSNDKIHTWNLTVEGYSASCNLYFERNQFLEITKLRVDVCQLNLAQVDTFANCVKDFLTETKNANVSDVKELLISDIFNDEKMESKLRGEPYNSLLAYDLFITSTRRITPKLLKVVLKKNYDRWLICDFNSIDTIDF